MARNAMLILNWFEKNDWTKRKAFFHQMVTPPYTTHTHFCTQIKCRSPANCSVVFVISGSRTLPQHELSAG
jgi:hypothetical protein